MLLAVAGGAVVWPEQPHKQQQLRMVVPLRHCSRTLQAAAVAAATDAAIFW
jgi:hypothetical protein